MEHHDFVETVHSTFYKFTLHSLAFFY